MNPNPSYVWVRAARIAAQQMGYYLHDLPAPVRRAMLSAALDALPSGIGATESGVEPEVYLIVHRAAYETGVRSLRAWKHAIRLMRSRCKQSIAMGGW